MTPPEAAPGSPSGVPGVSVLLPVRDGGRWLHAAVDSILRQTFTDLELILVDDHSRDDAIASLPRDDPRLHIVPNAGRGIVAALNTAAGAARAPLLARMDADDIALPQRLAVQRDLLRAHPEVAIAGTEVEIFAERAIGGGYRRYQRWINALRTPAAIAREIFVESPMPHPTAVMRRTAFDALGGYRDMPWSEDYDLWLRAFARGLAMAKPAGVLLRWRDSPARLSRVDRRCRAPGFDAAKAHFLARTLLAERAAVIWGAGGTGARMHDALTAEGVSVTGFVDIDPRKIGARKRGLPVWHWDELPARRGEALVLGAVGTRGARELIRAHLRALGWCEGAEFLFVA